VSETSPPRFTRNCRSRPCTLASQFSRSALSAKTRILGLALSRRRLGNESSRPGNKATGGAAGCHERVLPGRHTTHIVRSFRSMNAVCQHSRHYFILIALTLLTREPLQRGIKLRTMWRCVPPGCFTVTRTARSSPRPVIRAVRAPVCRHRSRQRRRFVEIGTAGSAAPMLASAARTPRPSSVLASFHPQGGCARK